MKVFLVQNVNIALLLVFLFKPAALFSGVALCILGLAASCHHDLTPVVSGRFGDPQFFHSRRVESIFPPCSTGVTNTASKDGNPTLLIVV